jgi:hypothetical protein
MRGSHRPAGTTGDGVSADVISEPGNASDKGRATEGPL